MTSWHAPQAPRAVQHAEIFPIVRDERPITLRSQPKVYLVECAFLALRLRSRRSVAKGGKLGSQPRGHTIIQVELGHRAQTVFAAIRPSITALLRS